MPKKKGHKNPVPERYQKNCVIYARISDPNKQSEVSIDAQIRECTDFAKRNGLIVKDVVTDEASGTDTYHRPGFFQLQEDAKRQEFRYILVWRFDRFSRSQQDTFAAMGYFGKFGISIVSIKEQENLEPTAQEKLMAGIYIAMAEYYSAELSIKVCRNMYEIAKNGGYYGGSTPLGYKVVDRKLEIDEINAYVVREAFNLYADGWTTRQLCEKFNSEGYKTSKGGTFNENSFRTILSNEKYIGVYSYSATDPNGNEEVVRLEGKIPALVTEELFNRVQERLRATSRGPGTAKAKVPYLLKDKIFCGFCGQSMKSDSNKKKNGDVYRYYNCRKDRPGHDCKRKTMPKEVIERNVAAQTILLLTNSDYIKSMSSVIEKMRKRNSKNEELKAVETKIKSLQTDIKGITQKLIDVDLGKASMSEYLRKSYEERIDEYSVEVNKLSARKEKLLAIYQPRELSPYDIEDWFSELRTYNINSFEDRQHIISKYVKQVVVYDDYMEVIVYQPDEIGVIQDPDTTLACAKTYFDFRNENVNAELPENMSLSAAEVEAEIDNLIHPDVDDDPDPNGPGGGSPAPSRKSSKKSTRPYNTKNTHTANNSAEKKKSSLAQYGEPHNFKLEPLLVAYGNGNVGFVARIDRDC